MDIYILVKVHPRYPPELMIKILFLQKWLMTQERSSLWVMATFIFFSFSLR